MAGDITDEFAAVDLKDKRSNRRLGKVAAALAKVPAASISAATGGWSETIAALRLLNRDETTPAALLAPHQQCVVERCAQYACVAVSQDTTEFDFTHMTEMEGLGPLNTEERRGFYMHSLYAGSEDGLPLGLLDVAMIVRDDETFRSAATRKRRPIGEKESQRWLDGYLKTSELARRLPGCEVFSISDREGDIFEVYEAWQKAAGGPRAEWIIRANQDRALLGVVEGDPAKLFAALAVAPVLGEIEFEMGFRKGTKKVKGNRIPTFRSARTVRQVVRAMKITPRPPQRKGGKLEQVSFWAILAEETDPPAGEEPIRWLLFTSKEVTSLEDARRIMNLYLRRWDIEVYHRVLKTGCRAESIQLKAGQAVMNAIMLYAVIAWRILYLTHLGRQHPDLPCGCVFEEAEWKGTCVVVKRDKNAPEPSIAEFIGIVGKLGGHLGRKSDGPPGPKSIWQGLTRVRDFALAWKAYYGE
jgi:hypothetical protein